MGKATNMFTHTLDITDEKKNISALAEQCSNLIGFESKDNDIAESNFLNEKIANIFIVIGIPAHITGYYYLREAIKLAAGNFEMVSNITTKLYPEVARHFNTSTGKVERCIRNAIEIAWNRGKIINLNIIFGLLVLENNDKPSSGELIALLAEKVYLDYF